VAARVLSPRSPNVLHSCRVSRALELIEFADDHPDAGGSGGAHVALQLKTARTMAAKPSTAAVSALQISPSSAIKRKRAHSLSAGTPSSVAAIGKRREPGDWSREPLV
jgi:hypothetical protein